MNNTNLLTSLNTYISSFAVASVNTKVYHWLITGDNFFVLHEKFEELYNYYTETQDKIAERVRALDSDPEIGFSHYLQNSKIKETILKNNENLILDEVVNTLDLLITFGHEVKKSADDIEDKETHDFIVVIIFELQKYRWMYKSQNA